MSDFGRLQELARAAGVQVNPPVNVTVPYVSPETAAVGASLNCTMGTWTNEPASYAYQWMRDGAALTGTSADYTIVADDAGHSLSCVVTATNAVGSTTAPPSNAVTVAAAVTMQAAAHARPEDAHSDARQQTEPGRRK
jgi:hypothetical protein